jgi:hypothetical protein
MRPTTSFVGTLPANGFAPDPAGTLWPEEPEADVEYDCAWHMTAPHINAFAHKSRSEALVATTKTSFSPEERRPESV